MSVNYYALINICPCCKRPETKLHIGQASNASSFLFAQHENLETFDAWAAFLSGEMIVDEEGREVSYNDFLKVVAEPKENRLVVLRRNIYADLRNYYNDPKGYTFCRVKFL